MANANYNLLSLNVRGLNNTNKRRAVFKWLDNGMYDIVLLQETHTTVDVERVWSNDWRGPLFFSHGTGNARGCCVLIRSSLDFKTQLVKVDSNGRYIIVRCLITDEPVTIVNVYAPNKEADHVNFIKNLDNTLSVNDITNVDDIIMGGDWNIIRNTELDKSGGVLQTKQSSVALLEGLMIKFNLNDAWRIKHPNTRRYTWRQSNPLIQCRLDYWLISDSLYDKVDKVDIVPSIRSDHSAITMKFQTLPNVKKGPSFWKFNGSLLEDSEYTDQMRANLSSWADVHSVIDKQLKWELIKYEIRKFTVEYSKKKKREMDQIERALERELCILERNLTIGTDVTRYNDIKMELQRIDDIKIQGMIIRSKVQWHEEGERSTKYFLGLEKNRSVKKHARKLKLVDGKVITDPVEILNAQVRFYTNLFSSKRCESMSDYDEFFEDIEVLSEHDKNSCEGRINLQECERALNLFKKGKSPGNDGITSEFYQFFWPEVGEMIVQSLNEAYDKDELSTSQRQAIITLIDKGKDRMFLENWRPISLLNVDYKIASKVLALRLHDKIPKLVDLNQTGFVKGRYMNDTVRTLHDVIEYCRITQKEGLLMMIDFQKAFDSLEWDFLYKTLEKMNFGQSFTKWVKLFYKNIESCISNNGTASMYFKLGRGVRQGDPLSSYLFILCVEIMSHSVMTNHLIRGITVNNQELKLLQYADDTTAILRDEPSVKEFVSLIERFGKLSGLNMNEKKTEAIWLGDDPPFKLPNNIQWSNKPIKVLGVYVGWHMIEADKLSISEKIVNIKRLMYSWKHRKLTLNGKVLIIKSLAVSQITYLANLLPFSDEVIKEIDRLIYDFLWDEKPHKVKKSIMIQDFIDGGHKMIDVQSLIITQKLKWVALYLNNHDCLWRHLMEAIINVDNLNVFLRSDYDIYNNCTSSRFYIDVLKSLCKVTKVNLKNTVANIRNQYLFYNKSLKLAGKLIYDQELFNAGLWRICDLFNPDGTVIPFCEWKSRGVSKSKYMIWRGLLEKVRTLSSNLYPNNVIEDDLVILLPTGDTIDIQKTTSKELYCKIIKLKRETPKSLNKYELLFPDLEQTEFFNGFVIPRICTKNNLIKIFQYKVIHRYLPTNDLLYKMKKVESSRCTFCQVYRETVNHILYDCFCVKNLWFTVQTVLSKLENRIIKLTNKDVVLGYQLRDNPMLNIGVNNVLLHVKFFIWKSKLLSVKPTYERLKEFISCSKMFEHNLDTFYEEM